MQGQLPITRIVFLSSQILSSVQPVFKVRVLAEVPTAHLYLGQL